MRYAASIRYGGELFEASELFQLAEKPYEAYLHLALVCPHCKEAVILSAESTSRSKFGKEFKRTAFFSHRKLNNKESAGICEARVRAITLEMQIKSKSQGRNQRLRLLQKFFWSIIQTNPYAPIFDDCKVIWEAQFNQALETIDVIQRNFTIWEQMFLAITKNPEHLRSTLEAQFERTKTITTSEEIMNRWKARLTLEVDATMHLIICQEVCEFLSTKLTSPLRFNLFFLSICDTANIAFEKIPVATVDPKTQRSTVTTISREDIFAGNDKALTQILTSTFLMIVGTFWVDEFEARTPAT
ncbi:hypothetical protein ACQ4M3_07905 [Leptolyngbya sp. AN03gr2]|uniref:hypothetical protein n=1 Tax=unclassified Leptolyngbya TaxID=2650499 RepID=UPI003D31DFAB